MALPPVSRVASIFVEVALITLPAMTPFGLIAIARPGRVLSCVATPLVQTTGYGVPSALSAYPTTWPASLRPLASLVVPPRVPRSVRVQPAAIAEVAPIRVARPPAARHRTFFIFMTTPIEGLH